MLTEEEAFQLSTLIKKIPRSWVLAPLGEYDSHNPSFVKEPQTIIFYDHKMRAFSMPDVPSATYGRMDEDLRRIIALKQNLCQCEHPKEFLVCQGGIEFNDNNDIWVCSKCGYQFEI